MASADNQTTPTRELDRTSQKPVAPIDRRSLNVPNLITFSRLILAVVLFTMIYVEGLWISAAIVFVIAVSTDFLDGYIARRYGLVTTLGRILDPFVDKIIICGTFVFLLEKKLDSGVNSWMVIIVIGREMFVTSLRGFLEQQGKDFSASLSGKIKMVIQCIAVTASLLSLSPFVADHYPWFKPMRNVLLWTAVAVTAYSGLIYVFRAYLMLRPSDRR